MQTWVCKFGGSSLADLPRIEAVAKDIVGFQKEGHRVVVVVSAMGKTTDGLIAQAQALNRCPPQRELDMLLTSGERISMALLSIAIHAQGSQAVSLTGSQSGIITENKHQGARIVDVKPARIEDVLAHGHVAIVAGYQGVSTSKEITTLGRGGSDTTAAALAEALSADRCIIFSDVDGVYTADPRDCPHAQHIPIMDYQFMLAMARVGAKVLNARAVEIAQRGGVRIEARKTHELSGRFTQLVPHAPRPLWAVVGHRHVALAKNFDWPMICEGKHGCYADTIDVQSDNTTQNLGMVTVMSNRPWSHQINIFHNEIIANGIDVLDTVSTEYGSGLIINKNDVSVATSLLHAKASRMD